MTALLIAQPHYPHTPGHTDPDTSLKAAESMADRAHLLRDKALRHIKLAGDGGLTADECAALMGETVLSVRHVVLSCARSGRSGTAGSGGGMRVGGVRRLGWR